MRTQFRPSYPIFDAINHHFLPLKAVTELFLTSGNLDQGLNLNDLLKLVEVNHTDLVLVHHAEYFLEDVCCNWGMRVDGFAELAQIDEASMLGVDGLPKLNDVHFRFADYITD